MANGDKQVVQAKYPKAKAVKTENSWVIVAGDVLLAAPRSDSWTIESAPMAWKIAYANIRYSRV